MATIVTYVPFSEINNGKPASLEEFRGELSRFARSPLLRLCCFLNALLRADEQSQGRATHDALVKMFFEPTLASRLLRRDSEARFVFHRQQLLFVAKAVVLYCQDEGVVADSTEFRNLGRLFLMAGDHLPNQTKIPDELGDKFSFIAAEFLPIQESSGFHRFDHKVARSHLMLSDAARKLQCTAPYFDIPRMFEQNTGISLLTFQSLLFASLTRFHSLRLGSFDSDLRGFGLGHSWFASTTISSETLDLFFDLVSATPAKFADEYQHGNWGTNDFTPFRNRPLLRDGNTLYPIDFAFLAEKIETGPFWTVHASLPGKSRKDLHSFWGRVFEKYGYDLLHNAAGEPFNSVYESPTFVDKSKGEVCDTLVVCGRSAVLLELKGSTFSARAKYASDSRLLRAELDSKLVGDTEGNAKAVHQLNRSISLICAQDGREAVKSIDLSKVDTIYPVIVTRDDIGSTVGVNAYLQLRFDEVVQRKHVSKSIAPIICLGAEDLERLIPYLEDCSFAELLSAHLRASRRRGPYLSNPYFALDDNAIVKKKGVRRPDAHVRSWEALTARAAQHLGIALNEAKDRSTK